MAKPAKAKRARSKPEKAKSPKAKEGKAAPANTDAIEPLGRKKYEKELRKLQVQLCHLQEWVKAEGLRVIIVFEGRDTAGKGGTIKALTERVSPRVFRVIALPARETKHAYDDTASLKGKRFVEERF
jgi:polyphosphate kinase 2 (PPK2 family)